MAAPSNPEVLERAGRGKLAAVIAPGRPTKKAAPWGGLLSR